MNPDWKLEQIEINDIILRDDVVKREVNRAFVDKLADSIRAGGLETPIRVRPVFKYRSGVRHECWELIAGRHRMEAVKSIGWTRIPANVTDVSDDHAELAMIDENLMRKDLEPAELAYQTERRKVVYERLHPETVHGVNQHNRSRNYCDSSEDQPDRFTLATAKKTGRSERSVQMAASIGKELGEEVMTLIGTSLNSITELDALRQIKDKTKRAALIERAKSGEDVSAKAELRAAKSAREKRQRQPVNDNALSPEDTQPSAAPEVAAADHFFRDGKQNPGAGGGAQADRAERHETPQATTSAGGVEAANGYPLAQADTAAARAIIERYGEEEMPFLLEFLKPKIAAAIRALSHQPATKNKSGAIRASTTCTRPRFAY